jgi:hypothetical protein
VRPSGRIKETPLFLEESGNLYSNNLDGNKCNVIGSIQRERSLGGVSLVFCWVIWKDYIRRQVSHVSVFCSRMSAKFFVGLASAGSAVVIFGSLFMAAVLFQDINNLYDVSLLKVCLESLILWSLGCYDGHG